MRVSWITPASFVDVDLPIIAELQKEISIYWQIIVFGRVNEDLQHFVESHINNSPNIRCEYIEIPYRVFDIRTMIHYCRVLKKAILFSPDLYYTSDGMAPFGPMIYRLYLNRKKTIAACHNVSTPKGANQETYNKLFTHLYLNTFNNINVFSDSQLEILKQKYSNKNVLVTPLAIKDYGEPTIKEKVFNEKEIVFLFFGIISPYKRLDLLIEASQKVYEQGYKNIRIKIAGSCKAWSDYEAKIKYPELFDTRIERIPNSEVANLFSECDYFVMPYKDIAQSGAITVAYRYNLPIILSDLPQFRPFGVDGETGFFFESGNAQDLGRKMIEVLEGGAQMHDRLKNGLSTFVKDRYSTPAIAKKYLAYFEKLLNK